VRVLFVACSSCVLTRLCFRSDLVLGFRCSRFADGPSFSSGRSGTRADGAPGLRGWSVFLGSVLVVLLSLTDGPWPPAGRSACPEADSLVPCFDSFLLLSCFRVCFKESFLRLEIDP
jgi:hypothetical protein